MSAKHLAAGSQPVPKVEGKLRLYSMEYCPYAQRTRLILVAKNIPHDIVNINLTNKPEWYFKIHPEGKVPSLDTGSKVIVESLDISDYLDQEYPDPPLYPADPVALKRDKELIGKIGPLTSIMGKIYFGVEKKTPEEWLKEFYPHLEIFEKELERRGSTFFFGDKPGMVDYMLWPWAERAGLVKYVLGEKLPIGDDQFTKLRAWCKAMRIQPAAEATFNGPEKIFKLIQARQNKSVDYDNL